MTYRAKPILLFLVKLAVTVGLLAWVFSRIEGKDKLIDAFRQADVLVLGPMWGLAIVSYWLLSFKMALILRRQDCPTRTWDLFGISAVTTLYGWALPGFLDLSAKWYILKRHTGKGTHAFSSMVYNQFTTTLVVLTVGLAAVAMVLDRWWVDAACGLLIVLLGAGGLVILHRSLGPRFIRVLSSLLRPLPAKVQDTGRTILGQLAVFQAAGWGLHAQAILLSLVANTVVGTIIYWLAAKAAGIDVPVAVLFWQCTAIFILGKLPISLAEFGVREWTLVGTLALYNVPASAAVVMSMVVFTNRLLLTVIGAGFQLHWVLRRRQGFSPQRTTGRD